MNSTHKKEYKQKRNKDKDGKTLYKLMNNVIYGKTMEILRNMNDVKLVKNEKDYLKMYITAKPYVEQNIWQ